MKNIEIMDSVEGSGLDLEESLAFIIQIYYQCIMGFQMVPDRQIGSSTL